MTNSNVQTAMHNYPQEEIDAMTLFYGGKRCVTQRTLPATQWAHVLDAALDPSNARVCQSISLAVLIMHRLALNDA